jgi:hypothetical protein
LVRPEAKDVIVTAGQRLIEQGIQQGIQQGRRQNLQEVLLRQLRQRFANQVDTHVEQRVATASVEELDAWVMRIVSAATLGELFAD